MRKIDLAPEPPDFDVNVRQPGLTYLASLAPGTTVIFASREYWRRSLLDLHAAYNSICAYTCHWIAPDTGSDTVEHFLAKSTNPELAYEWRNYRLVCGRLNGRKGAHTDVADPLEIVDDMFVIDFPSLQVKAGTNISDANRLLATTTVDRLKLNDERCIRTRQAYVENFRDGHISFDYLTRRAPFIAQELDRQGIRNSLSTIMKPN